MLSGLGLGGLWLCGCDWFEGGLRGGRLRHGCLRDVGFDFCRGSGSPSGGYAVSSACWGRALSARSFRLLLGILLFAFFGLRLRPGRRLCGYGAGNRGDYQLGFFVVAL